MAKKKELILIIAAVVIVIILVGGYFIYRYLNSKKIPANLSNLTATSTPITIINEQTKSNYIPPDVSAVLNLSAYKVDSQIRQLSNGGTQYVLNFETNNLQKSADDIRSQLLTAKFTVSNSTSTNFGAYNPLSNEKVQVIAFSPSVFSKIFGNSTSSTTTTTDLKSAITISWYKQQ